MRAVRVRSRHFNGRQPNGLNKNNLSDSTAGKVFFLGGLMRRIKIPQQDFALKLPGGLCARGGIFAGHYGIP